ncbi:MAG: hypothetical protein B7Z10_03665 [Rhodobacterales bacterium 32-66-7]|nr:MAG: hypothetical protein B7Z31_11830 [Rhodobacterales bacterium 12-65-15]OYX26301.1 MAG: hypothetical protein B7Z10_03665 [Rhodobacterales bacterium 32-66-7]
MRSLIAAIALLPTPALAAFDCVLVEECSNSGCEAVDGGPLLIKDEGDNWTITMNDGQLVGYSAWALESDTFADGEVAILMPTQDGFTGLINVYSTGELVFTLHSNIFKAGAITYFGNCASEGG